MHAVARSRGAGAVVIGTLVVAALAAPAAAQPRQLTPAETLAKVEATYKKTPDLVASFAQTVTYAITERTAINTGTLWLAKPDQIRFDYVKKSGAPDKRIVFDGATLWFVQHADQRITKQDARGSQLPALFRFFTGAGSLTTEFTVGAPKSPKQLVPGATVLQLTPKQPSAAYSELYLVVDPATWAVTRTTVINSSGDVNTFELKSVKLAPAPARTFEDPRKAYPDYKVETMTAPPRPAPAPVKPPKP